MHHAVIGAPRGGLAGAAAGSRARRARGRGEELGVSVWWGVRQVVRHVMLVGAPAVRPSALAAHLPRGRARPPGVAPP